MFGGGVNGSGGNDGNKPHVSHGTDRQLSENIPGMGAFWLRSSPGGGDPRPKIADLKETEREELVQSAYRVAQTVCDAFCPGDRQELLDAVSDSHKTYRRKFEKRMGITIRSGGPRKRRRGSDMEGDGWREPDTSTTEPSVSSRGGMSGDGTTRRPSTTELPTCSGYYNRSPPRFSFDPSHPYDTQYGRDTKEPPGYSPSRGLMRLGAHSSSSSSSLYSGGGGPTPQDLDEGAALSALVRLSDPSAEEKPPPFFPPSHRLDNVGISNGLPPPGLPHSYQTPIPPEAIILSRLMYSSSGSTISSKSASNAGSEIRKL